MSEMLGDASVAELTVARPLGTEVSTLGLGNSVDINSIKVEPVPLRVCLNNEEVKPWRRNKIQVRDDGIYSPCCEFTPNDCETDYKLLISKEDFIDAYNRYIKEQTTQENSNLPSHDDYFRKKMDNWSYSGGIMSNYSEPCFKCPKCGGNVRRNLTMTLASYPPQYRYDCDKCEYSTTGV